MSSLWPAVLKLHVGFPCAFSIHCRCCRIQFGRMLRVSQIRRKDRNYSERCFQPVATGRGGALAPYLLWATRPCAHSWDERTHKARSEKTLTACGGEFWSPQALFWSSQALFWSPHALFWSPQALFWSPHAPFWSPQALFRSPQALFWRP